MHLANRYKHKTRLYTLLAHKKAQLSLGKKHYSLCGSICSTDLQGHTRSM